MAFTSAQEEEEFGANPRPNPRAETGIIEICARVLLSDQQSDGRLGQRFNVLIMLDLS
mgnify:CR=1 FL=1